MTGIDFGRQFTQFLEQYRKPDGSRWRNKELADATNGFVTGNYVSNLKKGKISNPSHDRLLAIADVMGFPAELWYRTGALEEGRQGPTLAEKLNFMIASRNDPRTGGMMTEEAVSEMTSGSVSVDLLQTARNGEVESLTPSQYDALSKVFGVDIAFWYEGYGAVPTLDTRTLESLRDKDAEEVLNKFHRLKNQEDRDLIRSLLDRFSSRNG